MAFCRSCGTQVDDLASSCPSCGQLRAVAQASPAAAARRPPSVGFLGSLLDLSFTSFVTTRLIKVIYVLSMVISVLGALILFVIALRMGGFTGVVTALVMVPALLVFYVISMRIVLEVLIVVFRMAEHTAEIARQGRRPADA